MAAEAADFVGLGDEGAWDDEADCIRPDDIRVLQPVGDGQASTVHRGLCQGVEVAVKTLLKSHNDMAAKERINVAREVSILRRVQHDHLVLYIGYTERCGRLAIVTEFCRGGDAFNLLHNSGLTPSWSQKLIITEDVVSAMVYLHSCNPVIIHRDLKSLNVLLVAQIKTSKDVPFIKIADFGAARGLVGSPNGMTRNAGTYHWMAPEVLLMESYDTKVDVYSFAMLLHEIICQRVPFQEFKPERLCLMVVKGARPNLSRVPQDCPAMLRDLMEECWAQDPSIRPSFQQIADRLGDDTGPPAAAKSASAGGAAAGDHDRDRACDAAAAAGYRGREDAEAT